MNESEVAFVKVMGPETPIYWGAVSVVIVGDLVEVPSPLPFGSVPEGATADQVWL
jgi:hypothetical protein